MHIFATTCACIIEYVHPEVTKSQEQLWSSFDGLTRSQRVPLSLGWLDPDPWTIPEIPSVAQCEPSRSSRALPELAADWTCSSVKIWVETRHLKAVVFAEPLCRAGEKTCANANLNIGFRYWWIGPQAGRIHPRKTPSCPEVLFCAYRSVAFQKVEIQRNAQSEGQNKKLCQWTNLFLTWDVAGIWPTVWKFQSEMLFVLDLRSVHLWLSVALLHPGYRRTFLLLPCLQHLQILFQEGRIQGSNCQSREWRIDSVCMFITNIVSTSTFSSCHPVTFLLVQKRHKQESFRYLRHGTLLQEYKYYLEEHMACGTFLHLERNILRLIAIIRVCQFSFLHIAVRVPHYAVSFVKFRFTRPIESSFAQVASAWVQNYPKTLSSEQNPFGGRGRPKEVTVREWWHSACTLNWTKQSTINQRIEYGNPQRKATMNLRPACQEEKTDDAVKEVALCLFFFPSCHT